MHLARHSRTTETPSFPRRRSWPSRVRDSRDQRPTRSTTQSIPLDVRRQAAVTRRQRLRALRREHRLELGARRRTRYCLGMARTRKAQESDVIAKLADAGEDALRRLVDLPRRMVVEVMDGVGDRLHDVATRLRAIDPLVGRVAAIEKRLDSFEKPKRTTARRAPTRARSSTARRASRAVAVVEPQQNERCTRPSQGRVTRWVAARSSRRCLDSRGEGAISRPAVAGQGVAGSRLSGR